MFKKKIFITQSASFVSAHNFINIFFARIIEQVQFKWSRIWGFNLQQMEGRINNTKQHGEQTSRVNQRRKFFQQSIRREELQSYFAQKRQELTKNYLDRSKRYQLPPSIEIVEKRNQYVKNMYLFFRNQPIINWKYKIEELTSSITYFQGDFGSWIEYNLTPVLAQVFRQNAGLPEIQVLVAKLFLSQICHSNPKDCISNAYISDSLIVDNVCILLKTNSYLYHQQKICFVTLLAQIASLSNTLRDRIVQIGIGQILVRFAEELIDNQHHEEQMILMFLGCCENFCKVFIRRSLLYFSDIHFSCQVIAILVKVISKTNNKSIIESSLSCLYTILKNKDDSLVRKMVEQKPDIFQHLQCLLRNGEMQTKEIVLNLYRVMALCHSKHIDSYINPIEIFASIQIQMERLHTTRSFIVTALKVVEMILNNKITVAILMEHSLWKIVLELLKSQQNDIKKAAYSILVEMSGFLIKNTNELNQFIKSYNLLPLLITEISDLTFKSSCILHALTLIERYIQDNAEQSHDFNLAIYNLQNHYDLINLLENLVEINREGPEFDVIRQKAGKLVDVMVNHYSNDSM